MGCAAYAGRCRRHTRLIAYLREGALSRPPPDGLPVVLGQPADSLILNVILFLQKYPLSSCVRVGLALGRIEAMRRRCGDFWFDGAKII